MGNIYALWLGHLAAAWARLPDHRCIALDGFGGWRYDPCELVAPGSARPRPSQPWIDQEDDEEEFLDWAEHVETPEEATDDCMDES